MTDALAKQSNVRPPRATREAEVDHCLKEIDSLRARLLAAERKLGTAWEPDESHREEPAERAHRLRSRPHRTLAWDDLATIRKHLGDGARDELWDEICARAFSNLESGDSAAEVVLRDYDNGPYDRARFLLMRASIIEEWQPRPGMEAMLVDHLVQAQWAYEQWMAQHLQMTTVPSLPEPDICAGAKARGAWYPPMLSTVEAQQHSLAMATRWQNQVLKIVRHLRDLRRHRQVLIQNAGQVNVGAQQVNVLESS